jgi:hypothetical protein
MSLNCGQKRAFIHEAIYEHGEPRWKILTGGKTEELGEKTVPMPLCPPISHMD